LTTTRGRCQCRAIVYGFEGPPPPEFVAVGKIVSAYGYASTVEREEMRITIDGKTVELR